MVAILGGKRVADSFRKTVSGDASGAPAWSAQMSIGNDIGYFGPASAHHSLAHNYLAILRDAAIATIDEPFLTVSGLKPRSRSWLKLSRVLLNFLSYLLGHESPSQRIARARIQRIELAI